MCDAWLDGPKRRNMLDRRRDMAPIGVCKADAKRESNKVRRENAKWAVRKGLADLE